MTAAENRILLGVVRPSQYREMSNQPLISNPNKPLTVKSVIIKDNGQIVQVDQIVKKTDPPLSQKLLFFKNKLGVQAFCKLFPEILLINL
jgi:hypothetical protein